MSVVWIAGSTVAQDVPPVPTVPEPVPPTECDEADDGTYECQRVDASWLTPDSQSTLELGDNEASAMLDLGFVFPWYGAEHSQVAVSSNGLLCFDSTRCDQFAPHPTPGPEAPNDIVACLWQNLDPSAGGTITYGPADADGVATFVVTFEQVPPSWGLPSVVPTAGLPTNTFQLQLLEDGRAHCMLRAVADGLDGRPTVIGAENADGSQGVRFTASEFMMIEETTSDLGICFAPIDACGPEPPAETLPWLPSPPEDVPAPPEDLPGGDLPTICTNATDDGCPSVLFVNLTAPINETTGYEHIEVNETRTGCPVSLDGAEGEETCIPPASEGQGSTPAGPPGDRALLGRLLPGRA